MKRELFGCEISQKSKTEMFSSTDLIKAGNKWRIKNNKEIMSIVSWLSKRSTKEFITELEKTYDNVIIRAKCKQQHTWLHPYLFIDLALDIDPKLKIKVYGWLYDSLLKYRNDSGDSYKKMCGALYITQSNKSNFQKDISNIANRIKKECKIDNWENAIEKQLKLRNKIHEYIALFSDIIKDRENLIDVAIKKAKQEVNEEN